MKYSFRGSLEPPLRIFSTTTDRLVDNHRANQSHSDGMQMMPMSDSTQIGRAHV